MKLRVNVNLNARTSIAAEFEGKMNDVLRGANALMSFDGKCGKCASQNVTLQTKIAKGFQFNEYVCLDCNARSQWGAFQTGGFFLKDWEEAYQSKNDNTDFPPNAPSSAENVDNSGEQEPSPEEMF